MRAPAGTAHPDLELRVRPASFEDVAPALRLVQRAIEIGCRDHYNAAQRRAVYQGYAESMFLEVVQSGRTVLAWAAGRLVGVAQTDFRDGRISALFIDDAVQGHGFGRALLGWMEDRARAAGLDRLHGAMALNAVAFYARHGFVPSNPAGHLDVAAAGVPVLIMHKRL